MKENLIPCAEVHGRRIGWYPDVAKVTRAISRRNVHASGQRDSEMGEVPTDAAALIMSFRRGAIAAGMVIAEIDTVVSIVADRLRPLPAALNVAEEGPSEVRKPFGVAVRLPEGRGGIRKGARGCPIALPWSTPHPAGRCPRSQIRCGLQAGQEVQRAACRCFRRNRNNRVLPHLAKNGSSDQFGYPHRETDEVVSISTMGTACGHLKAMS